MNQKYLRYLILVSENAKDNLMLYQIDNTGN